MGAGRVLEDKLRQLTDRSKIDRRAQQQQPRETNIRFRHGPCFWSFSLHRFLVIVLFPCTVHRALLSIDRQLFRWNVFKKRQSLILGRKQRIFDRPGDADGRIGP